MDVNNISISQFSNLLKQHEYDIIEGKQKLSLTASLLQKINYALQELEYNHVSSSNTDSSPEESIKYLQELIHKTPKLTVTQKIKRETWRVDLSRFSKLTYLELCRIPMHLVEGMHSLHSQLQVLIAERCTDCLEEILGTSGNVWEELRTAKLCYNDFVLLCPFTNTPWLQYLDLSYNRIEDRLSLQTLKNLRYLNLSFNFLTSVPMLNEEVYHKLKVFLINNNYVQDLAAISVFDNLEVLDVSNNLLAEHSAISPIIFLPNLRSINLLNNPISYHPHHRFHTCSYLNKRVSPDEFLLDGKPLTLLEQKEIGRRGDTYRHIGISLPLDLVPCLPSGSLPQQTMSRSISKKKAREVVIDEESSNPQPKITPRLQEGNQDHLETKKQMEELRERFGGDHWLHSHAGSYVQDLMGLDKSPATLDITTSTPVLQQLFVPTPMDLTDPNSSRFDSSASEDYVSAMTTQAIIEVVPKHLETSTSDSSDQEMLTATESQLDSTAEESTIRSELTLDKCLDEHSVDTNIQPKNETHLENSTPFDVEEQEENDDGQLWLVQRTSDNGETLELFLVFNEKSSELREKSAESGRTTTKWSLESVESCEKINNDPPTVHITFNTIRKAFRDRIYIMEYADSQELLKRVRAVLEARSLEAMNQLAFRCMKCSAMFCLEVQPSVIASINASSVHSKGGTAKCPTCGSTLVVEVEEPPLPCADRQQAVCDTTSITTSTTTSTTTTTTTTPSMPVSPLNHSPSDCSIGSAASLEQSMSTDTLGTDTSVGVAPKEGTSSHRRCDSDIEIISNPSQSSIEVLEVHARLQGNTTPSRKRSNEERSTVAVPQLNTVLEVQTNLTESSSSGSLTDSVCTAYESTPVPMCRSSMTDVPEEPTPTTTPTPTSTTYTSLLQGLMQSVTSKLTPRGSSILECPLDNKVQYSYTDFSQIDHRIKLYLFQNIFKDDNEEFSFLIRGHVVTLEEVHPCLVIVSTHSFYILLVNAPEIGEDASEWFQLKVIHRLSDISSVTSSPFNLGVTFDIGSSIYLILFTDPAHTSNFFKFLNNKLKQDGSSVWPMRVVAESPPSPQALAVDHFEKLVSRSCSSSDGPVDPTLRHLALCSPAMVTKDSEEVLSLSLGGLLITTTDLLLLRPQFSFLLPPVQVKSLPPPPPCSAANQKLANIIDISLSGLQLNVHYLNESQNEEEVWSLGLSSMDVINSVVETVRGPWEQLFSVPLQLSTAVSHH